MQVSCFYHTLACVEYIYALQMIAQGTCSFLLYYYRIMNRRFLILLIAVAAVLTSFAQRTVELVNREWKYCQGDNMNAVAASYDDSSWQTIGLPHSFSIPYFMSKDFYVGYGWYRKHLALDKVGDECLSLVFDGVFQDAEVYVNGKLAGGHKGGYTAFSVDITPYAQKGDNVVAVRVNNLWQPTVAPRGGEHVFSGGIYRSVRLVRKSAVAHIRWQGICVTTPTLEQNGGRSSEVDVKVDVENHHAKRLRKDVRIIDADGKTVCRGGEVMMSPHLWSPSSPYLYKAVVRLYDGRKLLDEETVTFGFRWFKWSKDTGFWLNGEHFFFNGANVHQDQAGWGDAVTEEAARRDVRMVKEAGFTMIRGSHYPHSQAFVDECDRQGLLFWSEAPFWGTAGPKEDGGWTASSYPVAARDTAAFEANALMQLEEMITQHRNHPSVFVWSMCNEPFFAADGTMPGVHNLLRRMVERSHQLDPTRPAAIGGAQRPLGANRIDLIGDVAGYNGDGANIAEFQHPDVANVVSEYSSTTADRPGNYDAGWGDLAKDDGWKGRSWRGGQAIWCAFDHGSIFGENMAKMGIIDYFRLPKRSCFWYRNSNRGIAPPQQRREGVPAALRLSSTKTEGIRADGTDDVQLVVDVADADGQPLSNSPSVTLRIKSGPGELPTGRSITFSHDSDIRIQDGQCAIALRSYYAGRTVVEAVSDGLVADSLVLHFTDAPAYQEGVSPQVADRPYVRFVKAGRQLQTYGCNSPTFASTSAEGHSAGQAADGNNSTFWQPAEGDAAPSWTLDVERTLQIAEIHAVFKQSVSAVVEVSKDQKIWVKIADIADGQRVDLNLDPMESARFIRFSFKAQSRPQLLEAFIRGYVQ